jgi:peptidyl-prolyl cis-trans isomerase C
MRALLVLLACTACGSSTPPNVPAPSGPPAPLAATPAAPDDPIVATVDGKPVYGSCVAIQARRGASKADALTECIDFELLAQAAEGYATDPEVALATRTALASQLVARDYEDRYTKPADFGAYWERAVALNKRRVEHGEARASAYIRIPIAGAAPPDEDARARAISEELARALAAERGLMAPHLDELAKQIVGDRAKLDFAAVPPYPDGGGLVPEYARALFAIPEVGRTSGAVRTKWGWDVILLTELIPAARPTPDEIVEKMLPDVKRSYFSVWAQQVTASLGLKIEVHDDNVALLEDL